MTNSAIACLYQCCTCQRSSPLPLSCIWGSAGCAVSQAQRKSLACMLFPLMYGIRSLILFAEV